MKRQFLLLLLLLGSWLGLSTAQAQTTIARESFESATATTPANSASSFGYTSFDQNYFDDRANTVQFFTRSSLPVAGFNTANGFVFGTGIDGSWLVAGEAVRGQTGGAPDRAARFVQLNGINIAGKSSIQVLVSFADARGLGSGATIGQGTNNWENDDFVRIKARVNGGAWVVIGLLTGDNPAGAGPGRLRQDTNLNGISSDDLSAPAVSSSFQDFTFNLTGSGSTLDVMVEVDAIGGSEELALDNIRVLGTASATAAPVLANIETTSLNYNEGDPATQITNTVTVSDADSPNLTGGSVTLTTGFVSAQDRLVFVNQGSITGSYNTGSGVLTLSGTASLAAYQAALRSVRYQNIETVTAIGGLRLATFTVTDGTATSAVSRNIIVNAQLNAPAALPYTEDFETNGEGLRYASNTWSTSNPCLGFLRTNQNPYACTPTTFGGISGSYYWYAEGTTNGANPNPVDIGTLVLAPVNATNIGSLHFNVRLGIGDGNPPGLQWEIDDYVKFFYRVNGGAWVLFGAYVGDGPNTASPGNLRRDANLDGVADPGGTILTTTLQNTDFALPTNVTGASVDFMIEVSSDGQEELAMDRIVITGTPATTVNSIVRASANPTNAATVNYTVTFGAPVTGLTAANFSLTTSGISGATVGTPVSTGTGSTWTVPVNTGTGSGTLTLNLANDTNLSSDITNTLPFAGETYTIDKTAPTVSSVAVPANGTYRTGQTLSFTVNFSEAVTVTGTPQLSLTLDTGGSVQANYASGSGTAALVFSYTIVAGNADANGIAVGTLALNGGTIRDAVANNATLTLNGVPATTGILVDGIAPTVLSINRQTPTATTTNATSLTYRVTFSEAVAGVTTSDFSLTNTGTANGTISAVAAVSTSVYDVTVTSVSGNGTVRLDLNSTGTGITDTPAGNAIGAGYTSGQTYTLDQTAPTATLSSTAGASGTTTTTTPFSFTVTFSEAVSGFATSGITVTNGSVTSGPTGTSPGTVFTFTVTPATAGTATTVAILANAAQDAAGNSNTASATYSLTYTLPVAAATVITSAPTSITGTGAVLGGNVTANGGASVTERGVVYVLGTGTPTTSDTKVQIGSGNGSFSQMVMGLRGNTTYTVRAYAINSAGTSYGASQSFTTPNNPPTANADAVTVAEDSAPTVIPVLANDNTLPDVGETLIITSTTQPANGTVTINGGTTVSFAPALNFNGTTSFTYTISDGNGGTATATVTATVTALNDAPVVTTTAGNTTYTQGGGVVAVDNGITVTDVDNTTLASATVSIATGFVNGQDLLAFTPGNGLSGVYNNGTGVLTISGSATVAQYQTALRSVTYNNSSATPNTATRTLNFTANDGSLISAVATKSVSFAATTTVVSITQNGPSPTNASTVSYTVTFANAVMGVNASNFATITSNLTGFSVVPVTGSGTTYVVTVNTGTVTNPSFPSSVQIQFNNSTGVSPTVTNTGLNSPIYVIDRAAPTATITSSAGASGGSTGTAPIPFTVTFSESVTGFSAAGITVSNGAVTTSSFSGSGTTYTFTVTPTASGLVTVNVPASVAQDAAGNGNTAASPFTITYTQPVTAAPVLTTPANNSRVNTLRPTYAGMAPDGSTVTVYVDNASIGTTTATGGSFSLVQPTNLTEAQHTVYATAQTSGSTVSVNSNTNTFTVDATAPTVLSITRQSPTANPTNATSLTYRITFSEAVTGVTANDFSLTSTGTTTGTASAVAAVSTSVYDVTVTSASGNGTLRLDLNSTGTGIADLATNAIGGGYTSGQTYTLDNTAPTATISTTATNPTSTSPIPFTVTFSEAVTGFSASGVTVTSGTITTAITNVGNAYSFSVTPTTSGAVTVSVAANAAQDAAGNGNAAAGPLSITYTAPVTATTWTGTISSDWFTAGNWTGGVPTATTDATISASAVFSPLIASGTATTRSLTLNSRATLNMSGGTLDVRGNLTSNGNFAATGGTVVLGSTATANILGSSASRFWNLTVNASGTQLSTSAGASVRRVLTLTGSLATQGNVFTLESNSAGDALVVNSGGVVVGTATVQRAIDPSVNLGLGYRHYSAPVSNSTVADLATTATGGSFAPVVNPTYNSSATPMAVTPFPTVFGYDDSRLSLTNSLSSFDKGYFSPAALSDPLAVGRGYTVNIGAGEVVDFQGTLNNGDRTLNLTSTRATYPEGGWQLLGNPYPAPLNYAQVDAADRLGLEAAIYIYSSTSQYVGRYRSYINGIGNPVLPVGQAFFARVAPGQASATMTFRNSQRLTAPNGTTMQRTTADPRPLVQLTLQGSNSTVLDEAYVYFENGATSGFESAFDAEKLPNPTGLNLSTSLANGHQLSIDGQPELGTAQRVVPLAVGVPTVGVYTFMASQVLNLSAVPVYLRDRQLGTLTDLRQQPTYQFTVASAAALNTTRFELVFSPQQPLATVPAALAQQVALYPNPAHAACTIELPLGLSRQPVTAALLDGLGRVVRTQVLPASLGTHSLRLADLATGLYSLRLTTEVGVVVKKLVIE